MIQANIKFSIKNKACKETVPYCKEECKLSEDRKFFQIAFLSKEAWHVRRDMFAVRPVRDRQPLHSMVEDKVLSMEKTDIKEMTQFHQGSQCA